MDSKKIVTILIIVVFVIVAIVGIIFIEKNKNNNTEIKVYIGKTSKNFEEKLINDYKEMKKFTKENSIKTASRNYKTINLLEMFNEEYFETKKLAVIDIYEDNATVYEYHVDSIKYNKDKTIATIEYTNKNSGYNGNLTDSWINCIIIELEGTVTSVNFNEITK